MLIERLRELAPVRHPLDGPIGQQLLERTNQDLEGLSAVRPPHTASVFGVRGSLIFLELDQVVQQARKPA